MGQRLYMKLDGGRWVFRRRVPADLVLLIRRRELVRTIGACDYRAAQRAARRLAYLADDLFAMLRTSPSLPLELVDQLARDWYRRKLDDHAARLARLDPGDGEECEVAEDRAREGYERHRGYMLRDEQEMVAGVATHLLQLHGISVEAGDPAFTDLCQKLLRATTAAAEVNLAHHRGEVSARPSDPLFFAPAIPPAPVIIMAASQPTSQPVPKADLGPTIKELIQAHTTALASKWTMQTRKQNDATFRLLEERLGGMRAGDVTRRDISQFLQDLRSLPSVWGQDRRYRGVSFAKALDLARSEPAHRERLSQKTINRHVSAISGMYKWAVKEGYWSGDNPASGFIDKSDDGTIKRRPFRRDELAKLFRSPVWAGCRSERFRMEAGTVVVRDHRWWLPLLGLYTGARVEELARLCDTDFRETAGMWVVDLVGVKVRGRSKESTSNRTLPIHPHLVALGLLGHVDSIRIAGGGSLWPELARGGLDNKFAPNFSKWFSRYLTTMKLKDELLVFHSFRHGIGTALKGAGVPESVAAAILGHADKSQSYRTYAHAEGEMVRPLAEAIGKLDFGLDLSSLRNK